MGEPVAIDDLAKHHATQAWNPAMAGFVDKPVWEFLTRVFAAART